MAPPVQRERKTLVLKTRTIKPRHSSERLGLQPTSPWHRRHEIERDFGFKDAILQGAANDKTLNFELQFPHFGLTQSSVVVIRFRKLQLDFAFFLSFLLPVIIH